MNSSTVVKVLLQMKNTHVKELTYLGWAFTNFEYFRNLANYYKKHELNVVQF